MSASIIRLHLGEIYYYKIEIMYICMHYNNNYSNNYNNNNYNNNNYNYNYNN